MTAILQRKLTGAAGRAESGRLPLARVLRGALARTADRAFGLALMVTGFEQRHLGVDDLPEALQDDALLLVLEGTGGRTGAAMLSPGLVAALVQQQTMGRALGGALSPRAFTATDAALTAPLIEAMLAAARNALEDGADRDCLSGWSFGALAGDTRAAALALTATRFRRIFLPVSVVGTDRTGEMRLLLPEEDARPNAVPDPGAGLVSPNAEAFMNVPAELNAVLARVRMTLDQMAGLAPGGLVPIVHHGIDDTAILAVTGRTIARARLGQINGYRAVRLVEAHGPTMLRPQARAAEFTAPPIAPARPRAEIPPPATALNAPSLSTADMAAEISKLAGLSAAELDEGTYPGMGTGLGEDEEISGRPV